MQGNVDLSISVVSHGQEALVGCLLADLEQYCSGAVEVILTLNIPESLSFSTDAFRFPLRILKNERARGFGANHNAAFAHARADRFCILNPDLRFTMDPFPSLLQKCAEPRVGAVSAVVTGPDGTLEDHARPFPRVGELFGKALRGGAPDTNVTVDVNQRPDWIAGMFMMFRSDVYRAIGGFDERYFLYYEDVDLCARLRASGYDIQVDPAVRVVHFARRTSRRNLRYFLWHFRSMLQFLFTKARHLPPRP